MSFKLSSKKLTLLKKSALVISQQLTDFIELFYQ